MLRFTLNVIIIIINYLLLLLILLLLLLLIHQRTKRLFKEYDHRTRYCCILHVYLYTDTYYRTTSFTDASQIQVSLE